jgi:hypothetical protein
VTWLKNNKEPWPDVVSHWAATSGLRVGSVESGGPTTTVEDVFKNWPPLSQPLGYTLVRTLTIYILSNFNASVDGSMLHHLTVSRPIH